ncbi:MAG: hypothetical protein EOM59_13080 [Clostridia bacterium]|nr:hypothetical protein [Clostridia bacterium]
MKKIRVIARERIINPETWKVHNDVGLMALDGYYENVFQVDETYNKTMFILELEEKHPELKGRSFEIVEL